MDILLYDFILNDHWRITCGYYFLGLQEIVFEYYRVGVLMLWGLIMIPLAFLGEFCEKRMEITNEQVSPE